MLVVEDISFLRLLWLRLLLQVLHGFRRDGGTVLGAGEAIFPDFVKGDVRLLAGYNDVVGLTLHSESAEADTFLDAFGRRYTR